MENEYKTKKEELDVIALMRAKLPLYVVNCMLASGFDVEEVITSMDVSNKPGNSIEMIETFIQGSNLADQEEYRPPVRVAGDFFFPPGHRLRISNFVLEMKKRSIPAEHKSHAKAKYLRSKAHEKNPSKIPDSDTENESISGVSKQVKRSISSWVQKQRSELLKELKENVHFSVSISHIPKSQLLAVCIRCLACQVKIHLQRCRATGTYSISNWTRHVKICSQLKQSSHQHSLLPFLSPPSSGQSTTSSQEFFRNDGSTSSSFLDESFSLSSSQTDGSLLSSIQKTKHKNDCLLQQPSLQDKTSFSLPSSQEKSEYECDGFLLPSSQKKSECECDGYLLLSSQEASQSEPLPSPQEIKERCDDSLFLTVQETSHGNDDSTLLSQTLRHRSNDFSQLSIPETTRSCDSDFALKSSQSDDSVGASFKQLSCQNQIFSKAPLSNQEQVDNVPPLRGAVLDYSRYSRQKRKIEDAQSSPSQMKLTDYFSVLDEIEQLTLSNKKMLQMLQKQAEYENDSSPKSLTPILKQILLNAEKNADNSAHGRRHPEVLKKFATALYIYTGPMAYDFLQHNLSQALPSLRTVQRIVHSQYSTINEGEFRFDELLKFIAHYNAPKMISIGEDATRVISRVEYDSETDRCVGFVLPLNDSGLPQMDSFIAVSFEAIENMFSKNKIAKYAYLYMAQPLAVGVPPFCLSCLGTDNKFTTKQVMQRWKHIALECHKRGIAVVSFGSDGDSRLMTAMRICAGLNDSNHCELLNLKPIPTLNETKIPTKWCSWFSLKSPSSLAYVQDTVHIAVKLKCRMLKPSIVLPMGSYVAGVHHIRILQATCGKDTHGLRERDIDHKDKQNFDAVLHIIRAAQLLEAQPDALGTVQYVQLLQCVVDSYLSKTLSHIERIEKIWFATFFVRYWRQWIKLHPLYNLKDNFITPNAYLCLELNAHSLIIVIRTLRDNLKEKADAYFLPWIFGSQSCESIFRSARSMSSVFSTIINFGMLGLLRRIHRLQIQSMIQAESSALQIIFPQLQKHKTKEGDHPMNSNQCSLDPLTNSKLGIKSHSLSDSDIENAIMRSKVKAREKVELLGMVELLKKHKKFDETPSMESELDIFGESDSEDSDFEDISSDCIERSLIPDIEICEDSPKDVKEDLEVLSNGLISSELQHKLNNFHQCLIKVSSSNSVPKYIAVQPGTDLVEPSEPRKKKTKFSLNPFVQVSCGDSKEPVFIRKTTAVWLFQEGERVSSDRLFRVRSKQPYSSNNGTLKNSTEDKHCTLPTVATTLTIGDFCVFRAGESSNKWSIGKILQFAKLGTNKNRSIQQFKKSSVDLSLQDIGVLCSWFEVVKGSTRLFKVFENPGITHTYIPSSLYVCTLNNTCLEGTSPATSTKPSILPQYGSTQKLVTAIEFTLTVKCESFISKQIMEPNSFSNIQPEVIVIESTGDTSDSTPEQTVWKKINFFHLYHHDRHILLSDTMWLNDNHMTCAQILLKKQFPQFCGLQCSVLQQSADTLKPLPPNSLQIVHMHGNHWIAISTVNCEAGTDMYLYDSLYSELSPNTKKVLAKFANTNKSAVLIKVANVAKQSGGSDCGLFAVAFITHLAFGMNPCCYVFEQKAMRSHFLKCIENEHIQPFPVSSKRGARLSGKSTKILIEVYCYCRCPDDGNVMVQCESKNCELGGWFHAKCIQSKFNKQKRWICNRCIT